MAGPLGGSGQRHCLSRGRSGRCSVTQASGTNSPRISMFLCCTWWNSCPTSSSSSPRVCRWLLAVTCSVSGCCMRNGENWIFREIRGAILVSTADTCYAPVHLTFERISQYFQWIWTRVLRRFSPLSRRMEKCAQQMPQIPAQLAMRTFVNCSSHSAWLTAVMMARFFGAPVSDTGAGWCRHPRSQSPRCAGTRCTIIATDLSL